MINADHSLNSTKAPIKPLHEEPVSGFTKSDEEKLNRLADESASRASNQIKSDEASVPGDTIISNI